MAQNILKSFLKIRTFIFDLDGVLTDGSLLVMGNDTWYRTMNVKDGYALQLAVKRGYNVMVVSGSDAPEVGDRLRKLGITDVYFKIKDKKNFVSSYFKEHDLNPTTSLFMGDDVPDAEVMQWCGMSACPSDAVAEIRSISNYISSYPGGKGCARDVIEKVLKLNGDWVGDKRITST